jgi:hypothetical protein
MRITKEIGPQEEMSQALAVVIQMEGWAGGASRAARADIPKSKAKWILPK